MPDGKIISKNNILYYKNQEVPTYDNIRTLKGQLLTSTTQNLTLKVDTNFYIPAVINSYGKFWIYITIYYTPASGVSDYRYWLTVNGNSFADGEYMYSNTQTLIKISTNLYDDIYNNGYNNVNRNYFTVNIDTTNSGNSQQIKFEFGTLA